MRDAWKMAGLAFVTQNSATGLTFGSFGTIVLAIEAHFRTSRTLASLGISLAILTLSALAPLLGAMLVKRIPIRRAMIAGVLLGAFGYALLAVAPSIQVLLAIYMVVIGPSLVLFGALPSNSLVSTWFGDKAGQALGFANMPLLVTLVPLASTALLAAHGLQWVFAAIAIAHLLILPFALRVSEGPYSGKNEAAAVGDGSAESFIERRDFWLLAIGGGIIVGAGTMKIAHLVAIVTEQGHSIATGTMLLAISGGTGMIGSLLFGWLADRIGGVPALILNALVQCATFFILLAPVGIPLLVLDSALIGACGGGVMAVKGVIFGHLFGQRNFPRVFGLMSIATLPFLFAMTPLAGLLYDHSGSYTLPVIATIGLLALAAIILSPLIAVERRARGAPDIRLAGEFR